MSEPSKEAADLAAKLSTKTCSTCKDDGWNCPGCLSTGVQLCEPADYLQIASAALELSGFQVEWFDRETRHSRCRYYRLADEEAVVVVEQLYQAKPIIQVYRSRDLAGQNVEGFAAILLHAARTAREWAGEGGEL